jgi:quinol monooxygenase YgiN
MMIIIHARFQLQPEQEQAFLEEIRPLIAASRAERGNISYDLMKDTETDNVYTMVELWTDSSAVEDHNKSVHFTAFANKAPEYLAARLDVKLYKVEEINR